MKSQNLLFLLVLALLIFPIVSPALAETHGTVQQFYIEDILEKPSKEPRMVIPWGCKLIDGYPGCPMPINTLDWRINLKGEFVESIILEFENLSPEVSKRIVIEGNAKWIEKNVLKVGKGKTILKDFAGDSKAARSLVAIPRIVWDEAAVKKYLNAPNEDSDMAKKVVGFADFDADQLSGRVVVSTFKIRYELIDDPSGRLARMFELADRIKLKNRINMDDVAVILFDGRLGRTTVTDWGEVTDCTNDLIRRDIGKKGIISFWGGTRWGVGVLSNERCNSEVAVFLQDHAMELKTPVDVWTDRFGDKLNVNMNPLLIVPVRVWLAASNRLDQAQTHIATANMLFNNERVGVSFNATYEDVSGDSRAVRTISNIDISCENITALQNSQWYAGGQLNVYYVNYDAFLETPEGGTFVRTGSTCPSDRNVIYIYTMPQPETLAHEIGHSFSLDHTNPPVRGFNNNNIMWASATGRTQFSLGQSFRMNVHENSTLNTNGIRTGTTRYCPGDRASTRCPKLEIDIVR